MPVKKVGLYDPVRETTADGPFYPTNGVPATTSKGVFPSVIPWDNHACSRTTDHYPIYIKPEVTDVFFSKDLYQLIKFRIYFGWKKLRRRTIVRLLPHRLKKSGFFNFFLSDIQTARSLNLLRRRKRHCDVRLMTETGKIYAHKAILVTFSQDLQSRLEGSSLWKTGKMSVDLRNRGFENVAIEMVIDWMYTGSMRCNIRDNFERLLTVSLKLEFFLFFRKKQKNYPESVTNSGFGWTENFTTDRNVPEAFFGSSHHHRTVQVATAKFTEE
jgi:BTB/POZ domain